MFGAIPACTKVEHARLNMMRAGGSCLHDPVVKEAEVYRKPLTFEAFYMVSPPKNGL